MGLEQGREVFALPWSMLHEGGKGCLQLIKDGATMVQTIDDITRELGPMCIVQSGCNGESDASSTDNSGNSPLGTALMRQLSMNSFCYVAMMSLEFNRNSLYWKFEVK